MPAVVLTLAVGVRAGAETQTVEHIPLTTGLIVVSALHYPDGDRENVVTTDSSSPDGVTYRWQASERTASGATTEVAFSRFVSAVDLAGATRLNTVFRPNDRADYPGYTAFTLSTAVLRALRTDHQSDFAMTGFGKALLPGTRRFKGTLTLAANAPQWFPVTVNGRASRVPAMQTRGHFAFQDQDSDITFWVLDDDAHPLILKSVSGKDVMQVISVEMPADAAVPAAATIVERELASACRAELPGIYFAFGTAEINRVSNARLADIAAILLRHSQWAVAVEGHTDNIGDDVANQRLSRRRAQAVIDSLSAQGVPAGRMTPRGFGASRPRESNETLEGRARNRRVELVRSCVAKPNGENP